MARTFVRQSVQIKKSDSYDDKVAPSNANYQSESVISLENDLNNIRSQINNILTKQSGNWYDDLSVPSNPETGTKRGLNDINNDLHAVEKKRILISSVNIVDISVDSNKNYVILSNSQLPANKTAAINVNTLGTVVAHATNFGQNTLDIVQGDSAISPKNLCEIVEGSSRDRILSDGRTVYGLLQSESNVDGSELKASDAQKVQISFVRINATGDALEAVPVADIGGSVINYTSIVRTTLEGLNEQDFLRGAVVDTIGQKQSLTRSKTYSTLLSNANTNTNVSYADNNLDVPLPDMSIGTFANYDVYLNGTLLYPGLTQNDDCDYFPGTTLGPAAKLKFTFPLKKNDVICVVAYTVS